MSTKKENCEACSDTGQVAVYFGEGDFGFFPCERCSVYNDQHNDFTPTVKIDKKDYEVKKITTVPRPASDKSTTPPPKLVLVTEKKG